MKALVKSKDGSGSVILKEVPEPSIGDREVLIRVLKTGVCGTDLHIYNWDNWASKTIKTPLIIGHEFVGTIEKVGSAVSGFKKGDLVSGEGHVVCGKCRYCLAGRRHLCANTAGVGVTRDGAFAEFIALPETNIWFHDPKIATNKLSLEVASIFDPFGNAVHSTLSFPMIGEDVLITGAGPIGIMSAAIAKYIGARFVVVTDINPYRRKLAEELGATLVIDPKVQNLKDVQRDLGMKAGFDIGLEMSGNGEAFNDMINNMNFGGQIALLGIPSKDMTIDWNRVIFRMLTIKGIYGREIFDTWYKMTVLLQGGLDISKVITHRFHYTDFEEAFKLMNSGNCGKVILEWSEV